MSNKFKVAALTAAFALIGSATPALAQDEDPANPLGLENCELLVPGTPLSVLRSLDAPPPAIVADEVGLVLVRPGRAVHGGVALDARVHREVADVVPVDGDGPAEVIAASAVPRCANRLGRSAPR